VPPRIGAAGGFSAHQQIFVHRHAPENPPTLRRLGDPTPHDQMCRQMRDVVAFMQDRAGASPRVAANGHHQRRFARAVGTYQRNDLAGIDLQIDISKRLHGAVERRNT
jgi:hypothetical protein